MEKRTLFGYLMELGWITEEEAAEAAGVTSETIKEWKACNGTPTGTEALSEIIFAGADRKKLSEILEQILPGSSEFDIPAQRETLSKALWTEWRERKVKNEKQDERANVPIRIYLPQMNEKIPSAVKAFWQEVEKLEKPCSIYIGDWGVFAFDDMESQLFRYNADMMMESVRRGFTIYILSPEESGYPEGRIILRRLPLYLNDRIRYYRLPSETVLPEFESWMTIGMRSVLLVRMLPGEAPVSTLINEPTLANYYCSRMELFMAEARPVNQHTGSDELVQIYTRMKADVHPLMNVYFFEAAPSFLHMPPRLLREVMEANGACESQIEECQRISMLRASVRSICRCTRIYNGDRILSLLGEEKYIDPVLSGVLGRQAYITCDQLKKQLGFFLSEMEHTGYTMYLPSFEMDLRLSQCSASIVVQEDSMAAVMETTSRGRNFYTTDLSAVGGLSQYMEQLCRMIPPVKKSGVFTKRLLRRYIQL